MTVWDRKNNCLTEETEYGKNKLNFLYKTIMGRMLLHGIFASAWFAKLERVRQSTPRSAKKIPSFIKKYKMEETDTDYGCFRDFFLRKREYHTDCGEQELIAVADARLACYPVDNDLRLLIKNSVYTVDELIEDKETAKKYSGGSCLVFRLAVQDYHRYVFLDEGKVKGGGKIKGKLHTVRPISEQYRVFAKNTREYHILSTKHFGDVLQMEIGALLVGKICNYPADNFIRLEEKGYFDFGGSTIVLLFEKGKVKMDSDIIENSCSGMETIVQIGERIGKSQ